MRRELRIRELLEPITVTPITVYFETLEPLEYTSAHPRFDWLDFTYRRFNETAGNG
jgi:hypothetical protein